MTRPCRTCANLGVGPGGLYVCAARRLPDPDGVLQALPNRTLTFRPGELFGFAATAEERERRAVERSMSSGPVEGFRVTFAGERVPFEYAERECPAWRVGGGDG